MIEDIYDIDQVKGIYVTKYFKNSDRKYFENGQIRFGTNAEYREAEKTNLLAARGDELDAVDLRVLNKSTTFKRGAVKDVYCFQTVHSVAINAWNFCCSKGLYSAKRHKLIRNGDPSTGYQGNPELQSACVFDLSLLLKGIRNAAKQHPAYCRKPHQTIFYYGDITYDHSPKHFDNEDEFWNTTRSDDEVFKSLLKKRPEFRAENESRIVLRIDERSTLPLNQPALLLQSDEIRKSIISFW